MKSIRKIAEDFGVPTVRSLILVALTGTVLALPRAALAAPPIIVGDGTAASCTELALRNALFAAEIKGGGTVRFKCGPAPVTIVVMPIGGEVTISHDGLVILPAAITPPNNTTIDGGGLITLASHKLLDYPFWGTTVVHVAHDSKAMVLKGLSLTGGYFGIFNEGTLVIADSTIADNRSGLYNSGGVVNDGTLTVTNSTLSGNGGFTTAAGGGISNSGTLTINHSAFVGGNAALAGGIYNTGTLDVKNSVFSRNAGDWVVGGILNEGTLTIDNSEFSGNQAYTWGGILNEGSLSVKNSTFSYNVGIFGGGISNYGSTPLTIDNCEFLNNSAAYGAGINSRGPLIIGNSTLSGNYATAYGGAIYTNSTLTITGSTITANTGKYDGGGIYVVGGISPTLIRTSVTGNTPNDIVVQP